jgi:hypothetical protein
MQNCKHSLVKPESRPGYVKFKTKHMAMNYIPSFSIERREDNNASELANGFTWSYLLTVFNPVTVPMKVSLSAASSHRVTLVTPELELGGCSELWDEEALVKAVPFSLIIRQTAVTRRVFMEKERPANVESEKGIFDLGPNWTTIVMEVVF